MSYTGVTELTQEEIASLGDKDELPNEILSYEWGGNQGSGESVIGFIETVCRIMIGIALAIFALGLVAIALGVGSV